MRNYTVRNQILYVSMIASISILLTASSFTAEAKSFDKESTVTIKGDGAIVQGTQIDLFIAPINNNKDNLFVNYILNTDDVFEYGFVCTGPSTILKLSGLLKASIEFNTQDLDCLIQSATHGDISITIQTSEPSVFKKYDETSCSLLEEDGTTVCERIRGTSDENQGEAHGTVFGQILEEGTSASISKINEKRTSWSCNIHEHCPEEGS